MSMISSQCDELRKIADELQNLIGNGHNYTWSGLYRTLYYAQQGLRSAADTIWELRCKLAGVVDQSEEIKRLEDENGKLRELLSMYMTFVRMVARGLCIQSAYPDSMGRKLDETEMRERAMKLGIEWCR